MVVDHLTLWAFITRLRRIQCSRDTIFRQLETVHQKIKELYMNVDNGIFNLVSNYNNRNIMSFFLEE